jgi:hypothetical protein
MTETNWRADPLVWGHGPRVFEVFLEPTCPFSARAFGKLDALLAEAGEGRISIKIRLQSQPWHMFSGVIVRAILAASTLPAGKEAAKAVLAVVAQNREEFEFERHCRGANMDATPNDIIARLESYSRLRQPGVGSRDQVARQIRPAKRHPRLADLHDRRSGAQRYRQRRCGGGVGGQAAQGLTAAICQPPPVHVSLGKMNRRER